MSAFLLYPLALLELGPRIIHHLARTLTMKETTAA